MSQFARPASDQSVGAWNEAPLWSKINEVTRNDSTLIQSPFPCSDDQCTVNLSALVTPASGVHTVRYAAGAYYDGSGSMTLTVALKNGTTTIASWSETALTDLEVHLFEHALTSGQIAAITSYGSNFHLAFRAIWVSGDDSMASVTWAEFEIPDPPAAVAPGLTLLGVG